MNLQYRNKMAPIALALVCLAWCSAVSAQSGGNYDLNWSTIDGGGGTSSGGDYILSGTIGQPDAAESIGGDYTMIGGFWPVKWMCIVDLSDLAMFVDEWLTTGVEVAADFDSSGEVDLIDYNYLANYWLNYCPNGWPW